MGNSRRIGRAAIALALALALAALTGGTAFGASPFGKPLAAEAEAQALRIHLVLPSPDALKAVLARAGIDVSAIPDSGRPGIVLDMAVSLNHAQASPKETSGFAAVLSTQVNGIDATADKKISETLTSSVKSRCDATGCSGDAPVAVQSIPLPNDLGVVEIAGADSSSKAGLESRNETKLVRIKLNLRGLIGKNAPLQALGDGLAALTDAVNGQVLPAVNPVLTQVRDALPALTSAVEIGPATSIPAPNATDLLDLTVLGGSANIAPATVGGEDVLKAVSASKVTDINLLGGWVSIASVSAASEALASTKLFPKMRLPADPAKIASDPAAANLLRSQQAADLQQTVDKLPLSAHSELKVGDISVGGILNVKGARLLEYDGLAPMIQHAGTQVPSGLEAGFAELTSAASILDRVAGVKIERIKGLDSVERLRKSDVDASRAKDATGRSLSQVASGVGIGIGAAARSDTLRILVEPKVPLLMNAKTGSGVLPTLSDSDFVPTGISLRVDLPRAYSAMGQGVLVSDFNVVTGVGSPVLLGFLLLGLAVLVKRFALGRR